MIQNYKINAVTLLLLTFTGLNFIPKQSHPNVSASANAEASAPRDIVLVFDTSGSMAYATSGNPSSSEAGDDPSACNANNTCQLMQAIKDEALEFVNLLDFSKDRVSIVTMTSQTPGGSRDPVEVLSLTSDQAAVQDAIQSIKVFEPRICDGSGAPGECLYFVNGTFNKPICEIFQLAISNPDPNVQASADPSSCPSSNIGGALKLAQQALAGSGDPDTMRSDASWEVIALIAGPANASTPDVNHPYGYCPQNTWLLPWMPDPKPKMCRDAIPGNERSVSSPLVTYINPLNGQQMDISLYDAEDYARDMADNLAAMKNGGGVKIYSIGIGEGVTTPANGIPAVTCEIETTFPPRPCGEAEHLLTYMAWEAGDALSPDINHGEYFFTPTAVQLGNIFEIIANNSGANTVGLCYVNDNAGGTNTGTSWANAYTSLQSALADSCTEIWVAAGTYRPHSSDPEISFNLENGVAIYGGFNGTETLLGERDYLANATILSGDLNLNDAGFTNNSENSCIVVAGFNTNNTAVLDGFIITGGNAYDSYKCSHRGSYGGGILNYQSSPTLTNLIITTNMARGGGGVYNNVLSSPTLMNISIENNRADYGWGGGMFNENGSSPLLTNVSFIGNTAVYGWGGGMALSNQSNPVLTNVTFSNNGAQNGGGLLSSTATSPVLTNVTFSGNVAGSGGGMNISSNSTLTNVTFSGNSASPGNGAGIQNNTDGNLTLINVIIANSTSGGDCVNDGGTINASSTNNLVEDASNACGLINGSNGNIIGSDPNLGSLTGSPAYFPLSPSSPAINAGTNTDCPATDQRGVARPVGLICDIGAYEAPIPLPTGWVGSVSVTSDRSLVSVGRPHIGSEVASYDGFSSGSTTAFVPMLFKDAFGGDYDAALYIQNVSGSSASVTLEFYDTSGSLNCIKSDSIAALASKGYWLPSVSCTSGSLPAGWVGGVKVSSDQPIVAVGRPHIGAEVMTYNGFSAGSTSAFIPMLFKDAFGGSYDSAFYIQNVGTSSASVTIQYFDNSGSLNCIKSDSIAALASKGYWLPSATCDTGSLPTGWVGGVKVSSNQPIVTVGRPHIGSQITTYDGFSAGSSASFVPMLFKGAFGGSYDSAFYLQNTGASSASVTIEYYDNAGSLNCTKSDAIAPLASKGYWLPSATCDTGSLPAGWVGGVKVSSDQPVVAVGRPHIGSQITTYNGFPSGAVSAFLPMLSKDAFGGEYDSAFYLQNTEASEASVTIQFFDNTGTLTCSRTDTIQPRATLGFWVPSVTCFP